MSLTSFGAQLLRELLPAARRGVARGERQAGKDAAAVIAKDVAAFDAKVLAGLDRDVVALVTKLDGTLRKANPKALARKYENMAKSPRRFLTGQPAVMAHDMREIANKMGADTVLQGDLHLHNFGTVVKADGKLKVRLIDFDEATIGPALIDVNRFATHVVLTGREHEFGGKRTRGLVERLGGDYWDAMAALAKGGEAKTRAPKPLRELVKDAEKRDAEAWIGRRAPVEKGVRRLERDADRTDVAADELKALAAAIEGYMKGLPKAGRDELAGYRVTDAVAVMSGTGSVGRPRYRVLLEGGKQDTPVILQLKAQEAAALERVAPQGRTFTSPARRGLAIGDVLDGGLDPHRGVATIKGGPEFLVERVRASDATLHVDELADRGDFADVVGFYANQAAKGHARGAQAGLATAEEILATLGPRQKFVDSLVTFSHRYADQVEKDHGAFRKAWKRDPMLRR